MHGLAYSARTLPVRVERYSAALFNDLQAPSRPWAREGFDYGNEAMRADEITGDSYPLRALFDGDTVYTIDYYQREYAWSEDDVRVLGEHLRREYDDYSRYQKAKRSRRQQSPPYFLGPFVYYEDGESNRFLVDGQQRFTTLHLIFIATRRLLRDQGAAQEAEMLNRAIM